MLFEDAMAVRMADDSARPALFDQTSLAAIAAAGYDHPELQGPYAAVFDSVELAVDLAPRVHLRGTVRRPADATSWEVDLVAAGIPSAAPAVTAVWRGAVTARSQAMGDPITEVSTLWQPSDAPVQGSVRVAFTPAAAGPPAALCRLPVTAAILARGVDIRIGDVLQDATAVRELLVEGGHEPAATPGLRRRTAVLVVWLAPASVLEDDAWPVPPGTTPDGLTEARRAAAGVWLARHGIALVPVPPT